MTEKQLLEIQQQAFFELGVGKIDLYHFEKISEIVIVKHGDKPSRENALKVYTY